MNDQYIVFDDIRKEFTKDVTSFLSFNRNGTINCFNGFGDTKYFQDIGLKDINGKSIYADCSIIEYMIHGVHEFIKLWGVVTYDENNCCYVIKVKNQDNYTYPVGNICSITKFNIKIIDTIQENKLGLIK